MLIFFTGKTGINGHNEFLQEEPPLIIEKTPTRTQKSLPTTPPLSNNLSSNLQPDLLKQLALMLLLNKQSNTLPQPINISPPKLSYKITSEPVVHDVLIPTTVLKNVVVTFGNNPVTTVLTSESTLTTQFTTFVTKTVPVSPVETTSSPALGGLGFPNQVNPLLLLLLG